MSHISFFADVDDVVLGQICVSLKTLIFLPLDMVLFKGDIGKELFIIAKGVVEVLRDDLPKDKRKSANQILLRSGSFFGEIALVMEVRRTCSVQARTVCEINILLQSTFDNIIFEHPDFAKRMNELVVARQMETSLARQGQSGNVSKIRQEDLNYVNEAVFEKMQAGLHRRGLHNAANTSPTPTVPDAAESSGQDSEAIFGRVSGGVTNTQKVFPMPSAVGEMPSVSSIPIDLQRRGTAPNVFDELRKYRERQNSVESLADVKADEGGGKTGLLGDHKVPSSGNAERPHPLSNEQPSDRRITTNTFKGNFNPENMDYDLNKVHTSILMGGTDGDLAEGDTDMPSDMARRRMSTRRMSNFGVAADDLKQVHLRMTKSEKILELLLTKIDSNFSNMSEPLLHVLEEENQEDSAEEMGLLMEGGEEILKSGSNSATADKEPAPQEEKKKTDEK